MQNNIVLLDSEAQNILCQRIYYNKILTTKSNILE